MRLFDYSVDAGLDFLKRHSSELSCPVPGLSAVRTLCCMLDGLLRSIADYHGGFFNTEAEELAAATGGLGGGGMGESSKLLEQESASQLHQTQTLAGIYIPTKQGQALVASKARLVPDQATRPDLPHHHRKPDSLCELISNLFVFAFIWAFGGCFQRLEEEVDLDIAGDDLSAETVSQKIARGGDTAMEKFDAMVYDLFSEGGGSGGSGIKVHLPPSARLIYQYYPDIYTNTFQPFDTLISSPVQNVSFMPPGDVKGGAPGSPGFLFRLFTNPDEGGISMAPRVGMIPTADVVRLSFLVSVMLESSSFPNIMVSGRRGVGKSQLLSFLAKSVASKHWRKHVIQAVLGKPAAVSGIGVGESEEDPRKDAEDQSFSTLLYHVSTQLESQRLQTMLGSRLMRQGRAILIPPTGKKARYYCNSGN